MKRRYKAGDWLRLRLTGEWDALAIIVRACRSRLFGYFFAIPAAQIPSQDELRALTADDAVAAMLFGGAPIDHGRWEIVATSLAFDERAWTFPHFFSRGAFGQAWTHVVYDPQTLQIVERRPVDGQQVQGLPHAAFASAHEVEEALRTRVAGHEPPPANSICEIRSPIDSERLRAVEGGGCIQFSTPLRPQDFDVLRAFIEVHAGIRVRVHGFRRGFDATQLAQFAGLRDLTLDVDHVQHAQALASLHALRTLRIGAAQLDLAFVSALAQLQTLELRSTRASLAPLERCPELRTLYLENTPRINCTAMANARGLRSLTLAHADYDLARLDAFRALRRLELRSLDASELPRFDGLENLECLILRDMHGITDLARVAGARSLRELHISDMPHLNVNDFAPLAACNFHDLRIDVGSRRKEREVYRLLRFGNT